MFDLFKKGCRRLYLTKYNYKRESMLACRAGRKGRQVIAASFKDVFERKTNPSDQMISDYSMAFHCWKWKIIFLVKTRLIIIPNLNFTLFSRCYDTDSKSEYKTFC